ncbi:MAG: carboxylating nicotinate-nucleotide diphosphorylase [Deltaproteobacteria bacterium]|nr:MAG: carboxylating nicotinate-nucleotide diphosphorylase [Deltaproteobacteria bacterium]
METFRLDRIIESALAEDDVFDDPVGGALERIEGKAEVIAEEEAVFCGGVLIPRVFSLIDERVSVTLSAGEGETVKPGRVVAVLEGPASSLLRGERVSLNFIQKLSGIATLTSRFVRAVEGTKAKICDTRKTTPGLRFLEKYAVRCGGGVNHRFSLSDGILIKENAIRLFGSVKEAVRKVRERGHHLLRVEVEVESLKELEEALDAGVDAVLLDNMSPREVRKAVEIVGGRALVEASGGITLENVRQYAEAGVDLISVGALTHSAPSVSFTMEVS